MTDHYDALETRDPAARERDLFARLPALIAHAMTAPGWAAHLKGVDPKTVTSRAALARLPLLRKSALLALQKETPPFGGLNTMPANAARRLMMSPGPIFEPEGHVADYAGVARAMFAAGIRKGDIIHNAFAYHLTPGGWMFDSAAEALGCAIIPGGVGNTEQQVEAIAHYRPSAYTGTPDFLKILLDAAAKAGRDVSSIRRALVSAAALPPSLRAELKERGVDTAQCYAVAETGVIAYETPAPARLQAEWAPVGRPEGAPSNDGGARERAPLGMVVSENIIVEIVRPGTGDPVADGEVGEVVVTTFSNDYPMVRVATGDMSAVMPGASPCGRTNIRIKGWMGRADQTAKVKGMFVRPEQVAEVGRRFPQLRRLRLVVTRDNEQDAMTLHAECAAGAVGEAALAEALQAVTKLRGAVRLVAPGTLPNDGKVIADERPVG
ncbi:MAG: Coenzyme A ligase [Pseudolabrys sp.]|jgi:phenylacetate-CoA ligase|nr:Coenzyme A ligase [Pseudolabrys sp.]